MAKFGEGDSRWIVNDLGETGRNVNQWHWTELDCNKWTVARLSELFQNMVLASPSCTVKVTGLKSVEGDSYLNVRKAKLIASYELSIRLSWEGTTAAGQKGSGFIELPYVADENHDEDPEIKVVLSAEDKASQELKACILASGKEPIYKAIRTYVKELREGVPSNSSTSGAPGSNGSAAASSAAAASTAKAATAAASQNQVTTSSSISGKQCSKRSIKLTERFYASKQDIYECFVLQGRIQAFTQSPAVVDPQPGGKFRWFNGSITGTFEELKPGERLVMIWRFSSWEDDCLSKVEIDLSEPEPGNTILKLKHTGLPEVDKFGHGPVQEQVEQGWQGQILSRIRAVFGYGV
eukprot:GHRR01004371.1.p1 GENE.GHRR01004371.1~~GHRR01004371.1.p1  ORF type:complete len:351 (+),score=101.66 GHRR01004371.1:83-1135(+)